MIPNSSTSIHDLKVKLLKDYATTFKIPSVDAHIIISNNMGQSYRSVFGVKINENPCPHNIELYHGLTLQPVDDSEIFTILINARYIDPSMQNINWISTLIHEVTHVYDFKECYNLISPKTFDELFDDSLHPIFNNWSEFHAMAIGHYFLRKHTFPDFQENYHAYTIRNYELPSAASQMASEFGKTNNPKRLRYVVMRFLGRLAVWQYLYPDVFSKSYISQITKTNPWMTDLLNILTQHNSLSTIFPHFVDIQTILEQYLSITD